MAYGPLVVFVETAVFTRRVQEHLNDGEYTDLQLFLAEYLDAGKIIKHSGGIRKLRWAGSARWLAIFSDLVAPVEVLSQGKVYNLVHTEN